LCLPAGRKRELYLDKRGGQMVSFDEGLCTSCGLCVKVCLRGVLEEGEKSPVVVDPASCMICGHCKAVCPTSAPSFSNLNEGEFELTPDINELPNPSLFLRFLRRRRSLRNYKSNPVEIEKLKMIIEAGRFAPTGGNRQGCEYIVVTGRKILDQVCTLTIQTLQEQSRISKEVVRRTPQSKESLSEEYITFQQVPSSLIGRIAKKWEEGEDQLLYHAPALILIHMKERGISFPQVEASLSAMHMILMAETLGLGTCIIGFLIFAIKHSEKLREVLEIPSDRQVHIAFTVGYSSVIFLRLVARYPPKVKWIDDLKRKNSF
jgi:nitroreductase/NAD-dependent dihydropyrimidine dehydrogenase PreA subunit